MVENPHLWPPKVSEVFATLSSWLVSCCAVLLLLTLFEVWGYHTCRSMYTCRAHVLKCSTSLHCPAASLLSLWHWHNHLRPKKYQPFTLRSHLSVTKESLYHINVHLRFIEIMSPIMLSIEDPTGTAIKSSLGVTACPHHVQYKCLLLSF